MALDPIIRLNDRRRRFRVRFWEYFRPEMIAALAQAIDRGDAGRLAGFSGWGRDPDGRALAFSWAAGERSVSFVPVNRTPAGAGEVVFRGELNYWNINLLRNFPVFHLRHRPPFPAPPARPAEKKKPGPGRRLARALERETKAKCPRCFAVVARRGGARQLQCGHCLFRFRFAPRRPGASWRQAGRTVRVTANANRLVLPLKHPFAFDDFRHPEADRLRRELKLERVLAPHRRAGELVRQLALLQWVSSAWTSGQPSVRKPPRVHTVKAREMFRLASRQGHNYFCYYKAYAAVQIFAALGWTARLVGADGHQIIDIWSNELNKWYHADPLFNLHADRDGIPLSACELRREYYRDGGRRVRWRWGRHRTELPGELNNSFHCQLFAWTAVHLNNDLFACPNEDAAFHPFLLIRDEHNRSRRWTFRGGKGDRYVSLGACREESDPDEIDFPLNQVEIIWHQLPRGLGVVLQHRVPGLATLQCRLDGGGWRRREAGSLQPALVLPLERGEHRLEARGVNHRGVAGPVSRLEFTVR